MDRRRPGRATALLLWGLGLAPWLAGCPSDVPAQESFAGETGPAADAGADGGLGPAVDSGGGASDGRAGRPVDGGKADRGAADAGGVDAGLVDAVKGDSVEKDAGGCGACPPPDDGCSAGVCKGGVCGYAPKPEGQVCDDGDTCTEGDACLGGKCKGTPIVCDDGDVCTLDACASGVGCEHPTGPDGVGCGGGLFCLSGKCGTLPAGWAKAVAAGAGHTCALRKNDGKAYCWGKNKLAQLGWNSYDGPIAKPVPVYANGGWVSLSSFFEHTCGRKPGGGLGCWGDNSKGATAASTVGLPSPNGVLQVKGALIVAAGRHFTCAVDKDQVGWCWGEGAHGKLAQDNLAGSPVPLKIKGIGKLTVLAAGGDHACAQTGLGVFCWGSNEFGQLGTGGGGPGVEATLPLQVSGLSIAKGLALGDAHSCAWTSSGIGVCWGRNDRGQVGAGPAGGVKTPHKLVALKKVTAMAAGLAHTCAIADGAKGIKRVWCWGAGDEGQLGQGSFQDSPAPAEIKTTWTPAGIAAGQRHTCAVDTEGRVWCWGRNATGQLATTAATKIADPVLIAAP